ncbi:hypothetical protein KP509_02G099400 [Ceratopteris richardii]|uniref:Uncharacterized protein n=1 Tax=Ceratopteris richardii TaxID=49495 RepID=A0A8T2VGG1_CERRI|nr:hypothetical protein KP509_02G099400 [Ceratopteris richardii]
MFSNSGRMRSRFGNAQLHSRRSRSHVPIIFLVLAFIVLFAMASNYFTGAAERSLQLDHHSDKLHDSGKVERERERERERLFLTPLYI